MYDNGVPQTALSRRAVVAGATLGPLLVLGGALANAADTKALNERFEYLSKNGNSNCTPEFLNSISTMPVPFSSTEAHVGEGRSLRSMKP